MTNPYKMAWHIRQFVKAELMDYTKNKKMLESCSSRTSTRAILIGSERIAKIENVLERLNEEDRAAFEIIFIQKYTQAGAETSKNISKSAYYNTMNKVIYLVACEMGLI